MQAWYRSIKKALVTMPPAQISVCVFFSTIIIGGFTPFVKAEMEPLFTGAAAGAVTAGLLSRKPRPPEDTFGSMD